MASKMAAPGRTRSCFSSRTTASASAKGTSMILHAPGLRPSRIEVLASTEDVLPTLADLAGLPLPDYDLTGESLLPHVEGAPPIRYRVVSSESTRQASLSLRTESWKLILPITEDAEGRPRGDHDAAGRETG